MLQHINNNGNILNVGSALKAKIKQQADFESPGSEAILNLLVAADTVRGISESFFAEYGITATQYNVLRILKGAGSDGHPRCEIAARMIERAPDITRLVDRLEKQKLAVRERSGEDRRQSVTCITEEGLNLLARIEPALQKATAGIFEKLSVTEWLALTKICEKIYEDR